MHIDHPRFYTWAAPCCFKPPARREGKRIVTRFQLQDDMENDLCSDDPWLILHKIDSPTKMRYIGKRVAVSVHLSDLLPLDHQSSQGLACDCLSHCPLCFAASSSHDLSGEFIATKLVQEAVSCRPATLQTCLHPGWLLALQIMCANRLVRSSDFLRTPDTAIVNRHLACLDVVFDCHWGYPKLLQAETWQPSYWQTCNGIINE